MSNTVFGSIATTRTYWDFESEFEWKISNFCCMGCIDVGDYLCSPTFTTQYVDRDVHWYMRLFPKGQDDEFKDYLALYLYSKAEIRAEGTFVICNNKGEVIANRSMEEDLFNGVEGWGFADAIPRSLIFNPGNGILESNKLTIVCKIKYRKNNEIKSSIRLLHVNEAKSEEIEDASDVLPSLKDDYEALLNDGKFSDISLVSEGKSIKAHKCVLANKSPVFAAMFDTEMKEKQENTVEISDVKYDVLLEMLRFVYTGKANNVDTLAGDLAIAADKYALDSLKIACEKTMTKNLNLDNAVKCLEIADRIHMYKLRKTAIQFIIENTNEICKKRQNLKFLSHDLLCEVFLSMAKIKE